MANIDDSAREGPSRHNAGRTNETERPTFAASGVPAAASERERKTKTTTRTNSFQDETAEANNGTLKETIVSSESRSNGGDDIGRRDKSTRENEAGSAVAKVMSADRLGETHERSLRKTFAPSSSSSSSSGREIKSSGGIDQAPIIGPRRRQPFRDIIGKREQRREELERWEGDLRQRLDMLECSIPAAFVWNVWRMAPGAPICRIKRILEKQFKDAAACAPGCRDTPSRHYDCRVREAEAERKLALKKREEARVLWTSKDAALEERKGKLEEAKKVQEEQRGMMERLNEEAKALREAAERERTDDNDESCRHGECGDTRCKRRRLDGSSSVTSVEDIRCLEKLQRLAEEEVIMKRNIAELERREEAYMRTLQQADELWSRVEDDAAGAASALRQQLDAKTTANQRLAERVCELEDALEKCRARTAACRAELEKLLSIEKVEAAIGRDDDVAQVVDRGVAVRARVVHRPVGRPDDVATVRDVKMTAEVRVADATVLARAEIADEEISARAATIDVATAPDVVVGDDKDVWARPVTADLAVDRQRDLVAIEDATSVVRPEDLAYEQRRLKEVREYLAQLGSLKELYEDDGEACPPDFPCNGVVLSPTGMTDAELIQLGVQPAESTERIDGKLVASKREEEEEEERQRFPTRELAKETNGVTDYIAEEERREEETTVRVADVETERKVIEEEEEEVEERIADLPVREVVKRRIIREENGSPVTTTPEAKKIEADRDIVIQRDQILSWMNVIDTIRATTAKHPNCQTAKKDADTLAEMIGAHVGIKPKEMAEEEDLVTIASEDKQRRIIKEDKEEKIEAETRGKLNNEEIKFVTEVLTELPKIDLITKIQVESMISPEVTTEVTETDGERTEELKTNKQRVTIKTKLEDKLMVPETKEAEPEIEDGSIPFSYTEEATTEVKAPIEVGPELLPNLTKEEISADMKPSEPISIENLSHAANLIEKDVNGDAAIPSIERVAIKEEIGKVEIGEKTRIEETVAEKAEVSPLERTEENAIDRNLIVEGSPAKVTENEVTNSVDKEETLIVRTMKNAGNEIMPERVGRLEVKADVPEEATIEGEAAEKIETNQVSRAPVEMNESIVEGEDTREKFERIPRIGETERADVAGAPPRTEVVETRETAQAPPVATAREMERADAEETVPTADIKEVEELVVDKVSPVADSAEVEKFEAGELPVAVKVPDAVEEKTEVEETLLIADVKEGELEVEKPSLPRAVTEEEEEEEIRNKIPTPITDTIPEKIDIAESPAVADEVKEEKIEMEKPPSPVAEILTEEPIEMEEPSSITDAMIEEKVETARPIAEEKIETIRPAIEPALLPTVETEVEEIEAVDKPALEVGISEGKDAEMEEAPAEVTPPAEEPPGEVREEEAPPTDKEEIVAEIAVAPEPPAAEDEEKEAPPVEKTLEADDGVKAKIPAAETRPIDAVATTAAATIEPRLAAQLPYFVVTKIEEREGLRVVTATETLACCGTATCSTRTPPVVETARPAIGITRADVLQQTEVVQITATRAVSTAVPPGIISERAKPPGLKASVPEIGDRFEMTGRKTLWRERQRDRSTVTIASAGAQTDGTSRVSRDRVIGTERARVPTSELLRSIKIAAAGLTRGADAEREIRTINYGRRSGDEAERRRPATCDCCLCGGITSTVETSIRSRLPAPPQIAAKTAAPPPPAAAYALGRAPILIGTTDRPIPYDRLCRDCKAKIQDRMPMRERHRQDERVIRKISRDRGSCACATPSGKSCRAAPRRSPIERRDQSCLAKIPKRKADAVEQRRKNNISTDTKRSEEIIEPLSPSCICFEQAEKTGVGPMKKGNCYCAN